MSEVQSQPSLNSIRTPLSDVARATRRWLAAVLDVCRYRILIQQQTLPKQPQSLLIICKGNICRSPLAEAYLKSLFEKRSVSIAVKSAGLETSFGKSAHPLAQLVGSKEGILLHKHLTQPLLEEHVERADMILVMEWGHRHRLLKLYPAARRKIFLLRQFYDHSTREVADPYSGTLEDFQHCLAMIKHACDELTVQLQSVLK